MGSIARRGAALLRTFFGATEPPLDLAILRLVVFAALWVDFDPREAVQFAELPSALLELPFGWRELFSWVPIEPHAAAVTSSLFLVCCALAFVGLATRLAALGAFVTGCYALGIPNFYGKVDHGEHILLWLALLMAASPSGDALSLDALRLAWRRADAGITAPPPPARAYALPLRFAWLLLGVVYFFPGFWKLVGAGPQWFAGDNLKFHLYAKWQELQWVPSLRIDHHPWLYRLSALGTIVFELSFVVLIFRPLTRMLAVVWGLSFHNLTNAFMHIPFYQLQVCYVALVDWSGLLRAVGRRLYPAPMTVVYDAHGRACRRAVATLRATDVFERIEWVPASDVERRQALDVAAWRAVAARLPLLWPLWLASHLPPARVVAEGLYARLFAPPSGSRDRPQPPAQAAPAARAHGTVLAVGSTLLAVTVLCGVARQVHGWPFACYPTFAYIQGETVEGLSVWAVDAEGVERPLPPAGRWIPRKFWGMVRKTLAAGAATRPEKLRALREHVFENTPAGTPPAVKVRFYRETLPVEPERWREGPVRRELLLETTL